MNFAVMPSAKGNRELITDLTARGRRLRKTEMMRIGGTPAANQAWLLGAHIDNAARSVVLLVRRRTGEGRFCDRSNRPYRTVRHIMVSSAECELGLLVVPNFTLDSAIGDAPKPSRPKGVHPSVAHRHYLNASRADPKGVHISIIKAARDRNPATKALSRDYQTKNCTPGRDPGNVCHLATARGKGVDRLLALGTSASMRASVVAIRSGDPFPETMNWVVRISKA
jgi:hypothetical protein